MLAINLCDGYGGFSLALAPLGIRTVCRVERDAYAAAVLVERMQQGRLDRCPIWDDLESFDGAAWRGRVDLVTAGFPCQPFSAAGAKAGVDDDRWLWPAIARIIGDVRPGFVFLENVPQLVRHGLPEVLDDLAFLGFDAEWGLYAASAIGAPHRRERFWLVAHRDGDGLGGIDRSAGAHDVDGGDADVGDACGTRRPEDTRGASGDEGPDGWQSHRGDLADGTDEDVVDAAGVDEREPHHPTRTEPRSRPRPHAGRGCFPPGRDDTDGWRHWIAAGGPQPVLRRDADGPPHGLADALHLGGNGLVPAAAREAWRQLTNRFT